VRVNVTDGVNPCKNIHVELHPDPACILHVREGRGLRTFCTDTSFGGAPIKKTKTDKAGAASFGAVPPGNVIVCLCKSTCEPAYSSCVFDCQGPSEPLTVPQFPTAVPAVNLVLADCKCPKKDK
jgi:hypothetical protein